MTKLIINKSTLQDRFVNTFCFATHLSIDFSFYINVLQGQAQITHSVCNMVFCYKIISRLFCNIAISHESIPYDILGGTFKLKL